MAVAALVIPWVLVAIGCWIGLMLVRQNGRILLALEGLEARLGGAAHPEEPGLAEGTEAPRFELPGIMGDTRVSLEQFRGRAILLVFFSSDCGFCEEMAPKLAALPLDVPDGRPLPVIVTSGDLEDERDLVREAALRCPVLYDEKDEVAKLYRASATPSGYVIDANGLIASQRVAGADPLLALATQAARRAKPLNGDGVEGGGVESSGSKDTPEAQREVRIPVRGIPDGGVGVGDLVKRMTDAMGIKACRGCERRRRILNRWVIKGSRRRLVDERRGMTRRTAYEEGPPGGE
jgi:peroxiredoxin